MNIKQENFNSMTDEVQKLLTANSVLVATIPVLNDEFVKFKAKRVELGNNFIRQQQSVKGHTKQKKIEREAVVKEAVTVAGILYVYAVQENNMGFAGNVSITPRYFFFKRDTEIHNKVQWIHDQAVALLSSLTNFGITAGNLTTFQQKIDAFRNVISAPRNVLVEVKTATNDIKNNIEELRVILKNIDRLMHSFSSTHPQFYSDYLNAREIIDYGHHFTRIGLFIELEDGVDAIGVTPILTNNKTGKIYSASANHQGLAEIPSMKAGTYTLAVAHPGYQPYTDNNVKVLRGKLNELTIRLLKE